MTQYGDTILDFNPLLGDSLCFYFSRGDIFNVFISKFQPPLGGFFVFLSLAVFGAVGDDVAFQPPLGGFFVFQPRTPRRT